MGRLVLSTKDSSMLPRLDIALLDLFLCINPKQPLSASNFYNLLFGRSC